MPASKRARASSRRDAALHAELIDALQHDDRTDHVALDIVVDGGVAHVQGEVQDAATRRAVARVGRRIEGIHAVWDLISIPGQELRVIDVGCGSHKQVSWAKGIDRTPYPGVDIVADLEKGIPLPDASVDHLFAIHILEHIPGLMELMDEMHRVLDRAGTLHVMVPDRRALTAIADPTHLRYMHAQTFKYFCEPHGQRLWEPLKVTSDGETIYADMRPSGRDGHVPGVARWFL